VIRQLWSHRDLLSSLTRRQFQLRYRQSLVGFAWAIVPSVVTLVAATLVFHEVAGVDTGRTPYTVFVFSALAPWTLFASGLSFGVPSVVAAQQMVARLAFPRAVLPFSMIGTALVDLGISSVLFVVFIYATGRALPVTALWYPVLLLIEIVLVAGIVLLGSALNVFARDIKLAVPLFVQLWLFLTPVMYPLDSVPDGLRSWYLLNPMTGLMESFRRILVFGQAPDVTLLMPSLIGAAVALTVGLWYFAVTQNRFADTI
jgi:lipopolysaccharide transport system permease protein